jgi:RHS repeat-associated protein
LTPITPSTSPTTTVRRIAHRWRRRWALGTLLVGLACALARAQTLRPVTEYGYDAQGNLTTTTAPLGRTTQQTYDALQRLRQVLDPAGGVTDYTYDGQDRLRTVIDPRQLTTAYTYNGLGEMLQLVSPDTGTSTYTYDEAGSMKTATDARGMTTTYTYDALHRVTKITFTSGTPIRFQYDVGPHALGRLSRMTDEAGTTTWSYDLHGRVTQKTQTTGTLVQTVQYSYDFAGRLSTMTYPSGQVVTYGYDVAGRLNALTVNGTPVATNVAYYPFGPPTAWTWGNGTPFTRTFDPEGRLARYTQGPTTVALDYDVASRIVARTEATRPRQRQQFSYDPLDRLLAATSTTASQAFAYDAVGNRTDHGVAGSSYPYTIAPDSNRLLDVAGPVTKTYTYDAAGNITSDGTYTFIYNARGRLVRVTFGARATLYKVNGLGQRVMKSGRGAPLGPHRYVYDEQGKLLGDYDKTGTAFSETVYLGEIPVAVLTDGQVYYVYADHLHTPRVITDTGNRTVWRWRSTDPFGDNAAEQDPDRDGQKFTYNVRFPGQYFDAETELHHNYFRDYDPRTGRYVQSDPIGLQGGMNTFLYAMAQPTKYTDPKGLLVPWEHKMITEDALDRVGLSCPKLNTILPLETADVDGLPESQEPEHSHWHGMCHPDWDPDQGFQRFLWYIQGHRQSCDISALARVLHALQDFHSAAHRGCQRWGGLRGTPIFTLISHGLKDLFPSPGDREYLIQLSTRIIEEWKVRCPCACGE